MLAEHFHHAAGRREKFIVRRCRRVPLALSHLKKGLESVGKSFVRTKDPKVPLLAIQFRHVTQKSSEHMRVAHTAHARRRHVHRIRAEIGHDQVAEQNAAVRVGIRAHAALAFWSEFGQLRLQASGFVEQLLRPVAPHPLFELLEFFGLCGRVAERHLMRTKGALHLMTLDHLRPRPSLG